MADLKISALPASTVPLAGTEVLPIVQSSATKQVTVANLTAGRTQTSNGIVQGTAATGYNFTANTPAAGMTSQLLNWYEQGTWTPTDDSGAGLSLTVNNANYTRVGRLITVSAQLSYPANASASNAKIGGLPFASAASTVATTQLYNNAGIAAAGQIGGSSASINVRQSASILTAYSNVTIASTLFMFTLTYMV